MSEATCEEETCLHSVLFYLSSCWLTVELQLRCDVVQEPFVQCSRCKRLHLECKIENNFKRIGKRSRNAEMEREIVELKKKLAERESPYNKISNSTYDQWNSGSQEAVATSLLDLKSGLDGLKGSVFKRLEDVTLTHDRVQELFKRFFTFYHPFLPFLDPEKSPDEYHQRSPLLFWAVLYVAARHYSAEPALFTALCGPVNRLMWATFAEVPQNYHVVKALILLCSWPFPTTSTSSDQSFIMCGVMMHIAIQIGLHRPNHAQDFTKFRIELREAEIQDRIQTWAVCNIVAQRIGTAYGQPSSTIYDWTLGTKPTDPLVPNYELPEPIWNRLIIEQFSDKVSKTLYTNHRDPEGLGSDQERTTYASFLSKDFEELRQRLKDDQSPITSLYLRAAVLHLRLNVFFSSPSSPSYRDQLLEVYHATISYLEACLSLESKTEVSMTPGYPVGLSLIYAPSYIFYMMLAAGFSLLKLMQTFLGQHDLDLQGASEVLTRTVWAIRSMSVSENDLAERLAEVLAQIWKSGEPAAREANGERHSDDSLVLKVRCRMSMSLVFDSVWRWRRNFQVKNGRTMEKVLRGRIYPSGPPDPDLPSGVAGNNVDPSFSDQSTATSNSLMPGIGELSGDMGSSVFGMEFSESTGYQVFDPLNWMLDGVVDFPYAFNTMPTLDPPTLGAISVTNIQ